MMAAAATNTLLRGKLVLPSPVKIPVMDRHHYSSSGGDHSSYGGYSYGNHGSSHHKGSHSIALSALTLLSFLFFLNILQNCLQEHMDSMSPQQVVVVTRLKAREAEKRKGEDGIVANVTGADIVQEVEAESWFDDVNAEDTDGEVRDDKNFVKLASKEPLEEAALVY